MAKTGYTKQDEIEDLKVMIEADTGHLATELLAGNRVIAHQIVDAIIDNKRRLEDLTR